MPSTLYQTWDEIAALLAARELSEESSESVYHEEYILHPGAARVASLRLDDHEHRHANPWIKAGGRPEYEGLDGAVTGYVVDGDLTVDGSIVNGDMGSPALIVLGDLRAKAIMITGDTKLVVKGDVEVDFFMGGFTESLVIVEGELRARVAIFWDEFAPTLGGLRAHVFTPPYYDPARSSLIASYTPTAPPPALATLFVPELQVPVEPTKQTFARFGVDPVKLYHRVVAGEPVLR